MQTRRIALLVLFAVFGTLLVPTSIDQASADGSPDLVLAKTMPDEALLGSQVPVVVTVTNPSGPNGYNVSFTETLPPGVSYVGGSAPLEPSVLAQGDGSTVLVWENVADAVVGASVSIDFAITAGIGFSPGDAVITTSGVYAHTHPGTVPQIDSVTGVATGNFSGSDTAARSTVMIPFTLTKSEPNAEAEVLRGAHDHQTVITLTIDNNAVNSSSDFAIIDFLPAGLEFLGCGGVDNSSGGEEYTGAGVLNPGNEPSLGNPCIPPSSTATVNLDPDGLGPLASGVYSRLTWNAATLATNLSPGATFAMDYLAAIPMRENTQGSVGDLTANLDNNTGALTTETETELASYAVLSGTYGGDGSSSTATDLHTITAEDLSIHKTVDSELFVQGDTPTFTLTVESSEYATSTGPISVTDTLPASLDFTGANPAPDSAVLQGDGSTLITWTLPPYTSASSSTTITVNTLVRSNHRNGGGGDGTPVSSNDTHTNLVGIAGNALVRTNGAGATTSVSLIDESSATQNGLGPSILKQVSAPVGGTLTCGDGTGVTFVDTTASSYRPGDRVCFRLNVDFPASLDTLDPTVTDFLPDGFLLESWTTGAASDVGTGALTFQDDSPVLSWQLADQDVGGVHVELVVSTIIDPPDAAADGDTVDNLMKLRYPNQAGDVFQLRDKAVIAWAEAQLDINKGVTMLNGAAVPSAPADGVTVEEADVVTFQLELSNSGTVPALDAIVRDILPTEVSCTDVSAISHGGVCNGANGWIDWDASANIDVAGGASVQLTYEITIPTGTSAGAILNNSAGVRSYEGETNTGTLFTFVPTNNIDATLTPNTAAANDGSDVVTSLPTILVSAATSIAESGNNALDEATIGETVTYTIDLELPDAVSYYNSSATAVLDVDKDLLEASAVATLDGASLPAGVTLTADDATNSITVNFPSPYVVPDGADQDLVVAFDARLLDVATNIRGAVTTDDASFLFENADGDTRDVHDSVDVNIVEPNIAVNKVNDDADGKVVASQVVGYTVSVENAPGPGVAVAHETVVVDTVPGELIVLEAPGDPAEDGDLIAPDSGTWNSAARTITWTLGAINPGDSVQLGYEIEIGNPLVAAGTLQNTAEVTTSSISGAALVERTAVSPNGNVDGDGYVDSDSSDVVVPVLDLVKSVSSLTATVGTGLTYSLDIDLPAGVIAYDVTVLDDLPPGLAFEAISSVTCVQGGPTCSPNINSATPVAGGGDVAFFLGDLTAEATADRQLTIEYVTVVDDVAEANDGSALLNTATLYWNGTDSIAGTPATPPLASSFSNTSGPWAVVVNTVEPSLTVDKRVTGQLGDADIRRARPGDTLSYTIAVRGTGSSAAYSATVHDIATDDSWVFTDTTSAAGVTNTDADPAGGLSWVIDGPIAPGTTTTITYDLVVPSTLDGSNEVALGPDASNSVDVPLYYAIAGPERTSNPGRPYRQYDNVTPDSVDIELDLAAIGNLVWFDANNDGVIDPSEHGLANVDVSVTYMGNDGLPGGGDDETTTVSTDTNGLFVANHLPGGNYTVVVDETDPDFLAGIVPSYDLDGTTTSPNGSWAGLVSEDAALTNVDFGYTGTGSIGDTIWFDQNRDGVIDTAEARLADVDVLVTWLGPNNSAGGGDDVSYLASTDLNGTYLVTNLPPGEYTVVVDTATVPTGYVNVSDPGGENDDTSTLSLSGGAVDLDQDFGYAGTDLIGDLVWLDQDNNGTQNGSEPGLGGVVLELTHLGSDGVLGGTDDSVFSTTTNSNGNYEFGSLPPGVFELAVTGGVPANTTNSADPDSASPGDSRSAVTLTAGNADIDQDFGFNASSVLGDRVWWDLNANGVQDLDEPGIGGIEVSATFFGADGIFGTVDDQTLVTTTNTDGDYLFFGAVDGLYTVAVTGGVPSGFTATYDEDSGTASPDETTHVTLSTAHLTADFGYSGSGSIGDSIWFDTDVDGVFGSADFELAGVDVELTWVGPDAAPGGGDDVTFTSTSAADGSYAFNGLPAGSFDVTVDASTLPTGLIATFDADSGTTAPNGTTTVVLAPAQVDNTQDFGYSGTGSIGDIVWFDRSADGTFEGDDVGLALVNVDVVWATPFGPQTFAGTTDAAGNYLVENLPPGDYTVTVDPATLPAGLVTTHDGDGGLDATSATTLGIGQQDDNQDFGYRGNAAVGGSIWLDLNGDGTQGATEPAIAAQPVEVRWQSPSGPVVFTTATNATGNYNFASLADGDYSVTVVDGIVDVAENTADPGADNDSTNDLTIAGGVSDLDQDFGYLGINSVGDLVWLDNDRDGEADPAEPGIEGVDMEVRWLGIDGLHGGGDDIVLPRASTDADGMYLVSGLPDGNVTVEVVDGLPLGIDTPTFDANSGTIDPDLLSEVIGLGVGSATARSATDQDFGFTGDANIGQTIWLNLDGDAVQDGNEPGVAGVAVILTWAGLDATFGTSDDLTHPAATTDETGSYLFDHLPPGLYEVVYEDDDLAPGLSPHVDPDGGDLTSAQVTVDPGSQVLTQNFGVAGDSSLTGLVFIDDDGDGIRDAGEEPLANVTVTVRWDGPAGPVDFTMVTNADGSWLLDDMPSGEYLVLLGLSSVPTGLVPTLPVISEVGLDPADSAVANNGLVHSASIGDLVWHDHDRSGLVTPGEIGVEHVRINLSNEDGDVVRSTESALNGEYTFEGLSPGLYTVAVDETSFPADMEIVSTPEDDDGDNTATTVSIAPAEGVDNADFGLDDTNSSGDPDSGFNVDDALALAFTGRSIGDLLLVAGILMWLGMMLIEGTGPRRKPDVVQLTISSDGKSVLT